jgi:dUTP pyrophosphatase
MEDLENLRNQLESIKKLQTESFGLDGENTTTLFDSLGIDFDALNDQFEKQFEPKLELNYTNDSDNGEPEYAYGSDSGFDLRSTEETWIQANDRKLIPTGLRFDIPDGYEIQVRSKSGLALKQGLMVLNSPGTIDNGYTGEIQVIVFNTNNYSVLIPKGMKIAQAVLCPVVNGGWVNLNEIHNTINKDRNENGFGSTGI